MIDLDKAWELKTAEKLLMRRLDLLSEDGIVQGGRYTQKAVAERIGVTKVCLHNWEYRKTTPNDWGRWKKWANVLDTDFQVILTEKKSYKEELGYIIKEICEKG